MAFKYGQRRIAALIEAVEKMRDSQEIEQLSTYVGKITANALTDEERKQYVPDHLDHETIGYDIAGQLPPDRLRELFEADDWGPAWESMDSEQTEYYEQDEGRIEAFNQVLALLHGDPPRVDQVCTCGHWFGEHNDIATRCFATGGRCPCTGFEYDREASTPQAIADRGGDPEKWPAHVKAYFAEQAPKSMNPWASTELGFWTDGEYGRGGGEFVTAEQVWQDGYAASRAPLEEVHELMDGREWSPDTLDAIAEILVAAGFEIGEPR